MKKNRHEIIIKMVQTETISTQEELMNRLHSAGFSVTQATVSRDIKTLGLLKTADSNGVYRYVLPSTQDAEIENKYLSVFSASIVSVASAGNIVAIKCFSGMASAAAAALDSMKLPEIVATLAGDDTIFVLCKNEAGAEIVKEFSRRYIG